YCLLTYYRITLVPAISGTTNPAEIEFHQAYALREIATTLYYAHKPNPFVAKRNIPPPIIRLMVNYYNQHHSGWARLSLSGLFLPENLARLMNFYRTIFEGIAQRKKQVKLLLLFADKYMGRRPVEAHEGLREKEEEENVSNCFWCFCDKHATNRRLWQERKRTGRKQASRANG
ncbi:MAG: hypothetical protein QME05_07050, partial [Candidatus Margulisbacteria bacterium]|nr:hypothetical protein [Candidatus Margulisiibacteriota bacterium]